VASLVQRYYVVFNYLQTTQINQLFKPYLKCIVGQLLFCATDNCAASDITPIQCDNGQCVSQSQLCNDVDDCGDNSDERDCGK